MSLNPNEVIWLTRGDSLRIVPSGLLVKAWERHEEGVEVVGPRYGSHFTVKYENLDYIWEEKSIAS